METRRGVCNLCEAICGLVLTLEDGRVTGVRGNPDDPLSRGHVCPKAFALQDVYDDPDRLRRPVRRTVDLTAEVHRDHLAYAEALQAQTRNPWSRPSSSRTCWRGSWPATGAFRAAL